ncbi:hypothetical protein HWD97_02460 [Ochrobactrum sp. C6C9]|uniref:twin-arginine translocation signal domain-containing protein n=1 Tax=Ochrobactrum sp. C6C9 TaxID=2736662 RepID=UPI0035300BEC|nr:hypothetical protein [Ochrobactrum sp. C6C9]
MLNRRSFLRSASAASAAVAVPVGATMAQTPRMTPDERIDAALAEIVIAFRERYPDCPIRIDDMDNRNTGCIVIVTHCADDALNMVNFQRRRLPV